MVKRRGIMSNEDLQIKLLKLEIEISELKCIVLNQSVTIMNLIDDIRTLKYKTENDSLKE